MRKLIGLFVALAFAPIVLAQVIAWEKPIVPGLTYRMEVDARVPRVTHAMRWSMGAPSLFARSEVASMRMFSNPNGPTREELGALMERTGAIAGINGDFFNLQVGEPLGTHIRDGQLLSRPFPGRASFGWGADRSGVGLLSWSGSVNVDGLDMMNLQGLNEPVDGDRLVLFTEASAEARAPVPNAYLIVRLETMGFGPTSGARGQIFEIVRDQPRVPVPAGHAVLAMQGPAAQRLGRAIMGGNVRIEMQTTGFDWTKIDNVISGGPFLLRGGKELIDSSTAGFSKSFTEDRHPRTAVGRTNNGDVWLVAVDGRQPMSAGASLKEMATIMLGLGCVDAVNLDGGGSTTLGIYGQILNRPSDQRQRPISNAILFFGPRPAAGAEDLVIQGPATVDQATTTPYRLIGGDGKPIPDREVLWSAMGAGGWVDQGGNIRALAPGPIVLRAYARGLTRSLTVSVRGVDAKPPTDGGATPNL